MVASVVVGIGERLESLSLISLGIILVLGNRVY